MAKKLKKYQEDDFFINLEEEKWNKALKHYWEHCNKPSMSLGEIFYWFYERPLNNIASFKYVDKKNKCGYLFKGKHNNDDEFIYDYDADVSKLFSQRDYKYYFLDHDTNYIIVTKYGVIVIGCSERNFKNHKRTNVYTITISCSTEEEEDILFEFVYDNIRFFERERKKRVYNLLTYSPKNGFTYHELMVKECDVDITKNYNDDFNYNKMKELCESDKTELILLHGIPGTGKSYAIRKLITDTKKRVIFIDAQTLQTVGDNEFFDDVIMANKDAIFVLEDCENLIMDRNISRNNIMSTLLQLTDGLVADSIKIKFICTFNTSVKQVDKALLRKGRLSYRYEFGPLTLDKTRNFIPEATQPMTLGELFNYNEDNGHNDNNKIGFKKVI